MLEGGASAAASFVGDVPLFAELLLHCVPRELYRQTSAFSARCAGTALPAAASSAASADTLLPSLSCGADANAAGGPETGAGWR